MLGGSADKRVFNTGGKVSVSGIFLVRIFSHTDWIRDDMEYLSVFSLNAGKKRTRKTVNRDTFHAVQAFKVVYAYQVNKRRIVRIFKQAFMRYF